MSSSSSPISSSPSNSSSDIGSSTDVGSSGGSTLDYLERLFAAAYDSQPATSVEDCYEVCTSPPKQKPLARHVHDEPRGLIALQLLQHAAWGTVTNKAPAGGISSHQHVALLMAWAYVLSGNPSRHVHTAMPMAALKDILDKAAPPGWQPTSRCQTAPLHAPSAAVRCRPAGAVRLPLGAA